MRHLLTLFTASLLLCSCGYHLGGLKPAAMKEVRTISVDTFVNDSLEVQASGLVTNSIAESLQRDGTFKLVSRKNADARVEGRVISVNYVQLRSSDQDTYRSTELGLRLNVEYRVIQAGTNKVLMRGNASNQASLFSLGNMQTSRTNALSFAARMAGDSIADHISNG